MACKVENIVWEIAEPIALQNGVEIYDVEFKKEGPDYFLRIYIDKPDGNVSLDDCEAVSRPLSDALDEADPISEGYYLEVSSPGLERQLKRQKDFDRFCGEMIMVKLFRPRNGIKQFTGKLLARDEEILQIELENGEIIEIDNKDITVVRLAVTF